MFNPTDSTQDLDKRCFATYPHKEEHNMTTKFLCIQELKGQFLSHWVGSGDSTIVECMNVTCFTQTGAGCGATTTTCKSVPTPS